MHIINTKIQSMNIHTHIVKAKIQSMSMKKYIIEVNIEAAKSCIQFIASMCISDPSLPI